MYIKNEDTICAPATVPGTGAISVIRVSGPEALAIADKVITCHMDVLKAGLEHEEYVTSLINDIYGAAYDVRDFRTMQFLDWFVKEQGEEETNANDLISKMELFGSDPKSLYMLNQELAARVYAAPSLVL